MINFVTIKGKNYPVKVSPKKMKQVRLKVFPSGEIRLSVPQDTPEEWIKKYLLDKTAQIEEKLDLFMQTKSVLDASKVLGISRPIVYELTRAGKLRCIRVGKAIRIAEQAILDYIHNAEQESQNL